jgi:nitroreductase
MRRLKTDPVDEQLIWKILEAATRAPSGGNLQPWAFVVVTDPAKKAQIGEWYLDGWEKSYGPNRPAADADTPFARTFRSADHLARNIASVPVLIFACVQASRTASVSGTGANVFPAVQNLMLAARALGLGTTLTTLHRTHEAAVRQLLGIPEEFESLAMIPVGWPKGKFGEAPRRPVEQVVHWESWGSLQQR